MEAVMDRDAAVPVGEPAMNASAGLSRRRFVQRMAGLSMAAAGLPLLGGCGRGSSSDKRTAKVPRIGYLGTSASGNPSTRAFVDRLQELGWIDGDTVHLDYFDHPDNFRVSDIDVLVGSTDAYSLAARSATRTVPIVMVVSPDPVGSGLIAGFAHPGGNVTGLSSSRDGLAAKRLDLLQQTMPSPPSRAWRSSGIPSRPSRVPPLIFRRRRRRRQPAECSWISCCWISSVGSALPSPPSRSRVRRW